MMKEAEIQEQFSELRRLLEEAEAKNKALETRLKALEPEKPWVPTHEHPKFDPMEGLRIPRGAVNALTTNVGDDLMRDIVGDHSPNLRRR
jgi:hypothetical protein